MNPATCRLFILELNHSQHDQRGLSLWQLKTIASKLSCKGFPGV